MVLDVKFRCLLRLGSAHDQSQGQMDAERVAEEMAASVPYHLTTDLQVYLQQIRAGLQHTVPGRPIGGLLMIHPLHVAANCTAVSRPLRDYMRSRLAWIGKMMGIGQANVITNVNVTQKKTNFRIVLMVLRIPPMLR
jgi:hypothetical protein